jgi:soluble lytic murein transglycosylase-like protein
MIKHLLLTLSLMCPTVAIGATEAKDIQLCMEVSAKKYSIHPYLIWAIAKTESEFNPRAIGKNTNGTTDIGLMQINDTWLKRLSKFGITRTQLFDPCVSVEIGAWILAHNFKTYGQNWRAIGAYNAKTEWKRVRYAKKVEKNLKLAYRLVGESPQYLASETSQQEPQSQAGRLRVIE